MRQKYDSNSRKAAGLYSRVAAEKNKAIIAVSLLAVMVIMWVKVLVGRDPQSAEAAPLAQQAAGGDEKVKLDVSYVELPVVSGRHDVLARDFFDGEKWRRVVGAARKQRSGDIKETDVVSEGSSGKNIEKVLKNLDLQAIWWDEDPQAYINGKLLSIGEELTVPDKKECIRCMLVRIEQKAVLIRCGNIEVTLKLAEEIEETGL